MILGYLPLLTMFFIMVFPGVGNPKVMWSLGPRFFPSWWVALPQYSLHILINCRMPSSKQKAQEIHGFPVRKGSMNGLQLTAAARDNYQQSSLVLKRYGGFLK